MKELLLSDALSPLVALSETVQSQALRRRRFLQTIGVAGVGLAIYPKHVFAEPAEAGLWRNTVTGFVERVCDGDNQKAAMINSRISTSRVDYAPIGAGLHSQYRAPLIFAATIPPQQVICDNGFQVNSFPFYDLLCPCRGVNDLNAYEIRRVTNPNVMRQVGCVLAPNSTRLPVPVIEQYSDHSDYRRTVASYGRKPEEFTVDYKRVFTGKRRSRYGYHVTHKWEVGPSGKPKKDVLLSDQDW